MDTIYIIIILIIYIINILLYDIYIQSFNHDWSNLACTHTHTHTYVLCVLSHVWLFETPWTVAYQTMLSMAFSRQEHWSGLPFPTPGDFLNTGLNPHLLHLLHWQVDSLLLGHLGSSCCWVLVTQSCLTLCEPVDCSPPGSSVRGIF